MADRFPLILNTSTNQIQEIPSGDNLDLTGVGINNVGVITSGNVQIGAATTDLVVTGDARITGILTIGTSSLKLDGPNNLVNVGTALTLGHTQGLQFHTQNLHSAGFEVNQINVSGASTMGDDVTFTGASSKDMVWDSSAGALDFADNTLIRLGNNDDLQLFHDGTSSRIQDSYGGLFIGSNLIELKNQGLNEIYISCVANGAVSLRYDNNTKLATTSSGVTVTGDGTFTGNVSVGGVLTYEDVTNVDSVGLITARNGITVSSGTATFQGPIDANGDLDVDGHTNLDNVSVAGVSTFTGKVTIATHTHFNFGVNNDNYITQGSSGNTYFRTASTTFLQLNNSGHLLPGTDSQYNIGSNTVRFANIYADTLYGDGSNLTGITQTTINNNANNRLITGSGTANTLEAESNLTYNGTSLTIGAADDIRLTNGDWTGNSAAKIQHHNNYLYITTGASGLYIRDENTNNWWVFDTNGHFKPTTDSAIDIGATGTRVRNLYVDDITVTGGVSAGGDVTVSGGAGALSIGGGSDIRLSSGGWTGNAYGKIQNHNQSLYICGGSTSNYSIIFRVDAADKIYMKDDGTFYPTTNNQSDLGTSTARWRNLYTNDLNLSNEGGSNDVDNTWGDYTIQEGESDLFLINNRSGKKYKFNLTEVS